MLPIKLFVLLDKKKDTNDPAVYLLENFHVDVAKTLLNFFEKNFVLRRSYVIG